MLTFNVNDPRELQQFRDRGRGCATHSPNRYQIERENRLVRARRALQPIVGPIRINVQFIHITDGENGLITEEQRMKQVQELNDCYMSVGIEFGYDPSTVKVQNEPTWYRMDIDSPEEREAKTFLHTTPERNLNFYTAGLADDLLGWATFPFNLKGDRIKDGVVILDGSLPGGKTERFNLGKTAVHEVGHWLGLYHTFEGGCHGYGDQVSDTVPHREADFGTPADTERNSACDPAERSPVHNYMNYCDDAWMNEFTARQNERIKMQIATYRPEFITNPV